MKDVRLLARDRVPLEALTPPPFATGSVRPAVPTPLADRVHAAIRTLHYSRRTERAYTYWIQRFITHHDGRNPALMGADEIRGFLSHLAVSEGVSASTQNQALCALVFLYSRVLGVELGPIGEIERAKTPHRLPVVLSRGEVRAILDRMTGVPGLVCWLLYGAGLRLVECLSLRVKDIDFERNELTVRDGKGAKDRMTVLPALCRRDLQSHLDRVRRLHAEDIVRGRGRPRCRSPWLRSIRAPTANGDGSTCSPPRRSMPIGTPASTTGIISTRP